MLSLLEKATIGRHVTVMLLETFVDQRFYGGVYRAANGITGGQTAGFRRIRGGYQGGQTRKRVFLRPLWRRVPQRLTALGRDPWCIKGTPTPRLTAAHMKSLYACFTAVADPRVSQGKRHQFATILA